MAILLGELAERVGGRLVGDRDLAVSRVETLERAGPGSVSFLANPKYRALLRTTRATAVIVGAEEDPIEGICFVLHPNPYLGFARAMALLHPDSHPRRGVEPGAHVHASSMIEEGVTVMAGAYVDEGARIGAATVLYPGVYVGRGATVGRDCVLHANAVVRERCALGERVILQPGVVIGSDGYGYAREGARHVKIPQAGTVVLEDDVEIGAGAAIDRAALGETRIGRGTKIDNLVQIGHNVQVGEDCLLIAQVGVSGSTRIGNRVVLAGQVGLVGHIRIGDDVMVGAQSGVTKDVEPGKVVSGTPAGDHRESRKGLVLTRRLPELQRRLRDLERRLNELERAGTGTRAGEGGP